MYSVDPVALWRIRPLLQRVLIVDPDPHAAALLAHCLFEWGSEEVVDEVDPDAALATAETLMPTLIVTEALEDADPFGFVRDTRRSAMACCKAPVVVVTTLATASGPKLAKDAGAHGFLRKPFSRRDLIRRLDDLASHPRAWVHKPGYTGPDRRMFNSGGAIRRLNDRLALIDQGVPATRLYFAR